MLPKLIITDIDGVWTDGGMYYTREGDVMKRFHVSDGWGVIFCRDLGIPVAIMTGENTEIVQKRGEKLRVPYIYLGVKDKLKLAQELCAELGISLQDVAFMGDDINDLPLLLQVGLSASPGNAVEYVKERVQVVTRRYGGNGAFREFIEWILKRENLFDTTMKKYESA